MTHNWKFFKHLGKVMIEFCNMKVTALKVLFLLTLYLICVKKHYSKQINVLEKCLGFSPTPSYINEADLRRDFEGFGRKMKCK